MFISLGSPVVLLPVNVRPPHDVSLIGNMQINAFLTLAIAHFPQSMLQKEVLALQDCLTGWNAREMGLLNQITDNDSQKSSNDGFERVRMGSIAFEGVPTLFCIAPQEFFGKVPKP